MFPVVTLCATGRLCWVLLPYIHPHRPALMPFRDSRVKFLIYLWLADKLFGSLGTPYLHSLLIFFHVHASSRTCWVLRCTYVRLYFNTVYIFLSDQALLLLLCAVRVFAYLSSFTHNFPLWPRFLPISFCLVSLQHRYVNTDPPLVWTPARRSHAHFLTWFAYVTVFLPSFSCTP